MGAMTGALTAEFALMAACALRLATAAIFLEAAQHALRDSEDFAAIVDAYRILPESLARRASLAIPVLQVAAAVALIVPRTAQLGAGIGLLLMMMFTVAITINISRGRTDIDCGCGGGATQTLSNALVARNLVLGFCLAWIFITPSHVTFTLPVYVGVAGFGVFLTGIYFAASQLIANAGALGAQPKAAAE